MSPLPLIVLPTKKKFCLVQTKTNKKCNRTFDHIIDQNCSNWDSLLPLACHGAPAGAYKLESCFCYRFLPRVLQDLERQKNKGSGRNVESEDSEEEDNSQVSGFTVVLRVRRIMIKWVVSLLCLCYLNWNSPLNFRLSWRHFFFLLNLEMAEIRG